MGIALHVLVVLLQYPSEELVFRVVDRLDDEAVVAREVEERARLSGRAEFRQDVLRGEREEVVGGIELEVIFS